jgi:hypothetical protein
MRERWRDNFTRIGSARLGNRAADSASDGETTMRRAGQLLLALTLTIPMFLATSPPSVADPRGPMQEGRAQSPSHDSQEARFSQRDINACEGHCSSIREVPNGTVEYGGYTQCLEPHQLGLMIALWRWFPSSSSWKLVDSVSAGRFGWLDNAVGDRVCANQTSTKYRMQAFPTVDGVQIAGYAGYSPATTLTCRLAYP